MLLSPPTCLSCPDPDTDPTRPRTKPITNPRSNPGPIPGTRTKTRPRTRPKPVASPSPGQTQAVARGRGLAKPGQIPGPNRNPNPDPGPSSDQSPARAGPGNCLVGPPVRQHLRPAVCRLPCNDRRLPCTAGPESTELLEIMPSTGNGRKAISVHPSGSFRTPGRGRVDGIISCRLHYLEIMPST